MNLHRIAAALSGALMLSACVSVPQGPTVAVMPGTSKSFDQFRADGSTCQDYALSTIAGPTQAAQTNAANNVAGSVVAGAVVGALLGAVTGQAGYGAAWGAGTGALFGSAGAGNAGAVSSYTLQRQFDVAYMQCMYARGNQVPGQVAQRQVPRHSAQAAVAAPAARYNAPPNALTPPPGTPPPPLRYNAPAGALTPPPDTPPPQGYALPANPAPQQN